MNILCYVEANSVTGRGHYTRIKILLDLLKVKKATIVTDNYLIAKKTFSKYIVKNIDKIKEQIDQTPQQDADLIELEWQELGSYYNKQQKKKLKN